MKKIYLLLLLSFLSLGAFAQTMTYSAPGAYIYTVGAGVTAIAVDVSGANGGNYPSASGFGGLGGRVQCNLTVTPGQLLYVYVGAKGTDWTTFVNPPGGSSSGGGEDGGTGSNDNGGAGGGAASDIRTAAGVLTSRLVVAGAGSGSAWADCNPADNGANGGGLVGSNGTDCNSYTSSNNGAGGNTTTGTGGAGATTGPAQSGGLGYGGNAYLGYYGSGGGGGYYGGGGGYDGTGGGGSSYATSSATSIVYTPGYNTSSLGNGSVAITVLCTAPGTITGTASMCAGATTTLSNPTAGATGTWISSNTAVATVASTGVVTGVSAGTATITDSVSSPCGALSATIVVTVNAIPATITGTVGLCTGATSTLSSATTGGSWSSSATGVATVGTSTGIVTGVSSGTATITYTVTGGCFTTQGVTVNALPAISGSFVLCPLATTTLTSSIAGGTWTSSNLPVASIGSSSGTVTAVSGGNSVISYTLSTGCSAAQTVTVAPMSPITGELGVCATGTTVTLSDLVSAGTWSSSNPVVATIGSSTGTVTSLSFGTTTISYSVPALGCVATAVFGVTAPPNVYTLTGGGGYCIGGPGVIIGLSSSDIGVNYQLYSSGTAFGTPVSGTGAAISFASTFTPGSYTITANPLSTCAAGMTGSTTVTVNPLPTVFTVTGGGSYCSGGTGVHIGLSTSAIGTNYQLYNGVTAVGTPVLGTSSSIDFGLQTTAGTYTVVATNATTGCVNNMSGSATITINPLPTVYAVTGGGSYCTGGTGVVVGLSNSQSGVNYQLLLSGAPVGTPVTGGGSSISFGLQTTGGTYTVVATNTSTTCTSNMSGSATVTINVLPTVFTVTGGGAYCSGGTGVHIGLNASTVGVNYQLYMGTSTVGGLVPGTGVALDFGLFTTSGSYTVVAINATTGCTLDMSGSAAVTINGLPRLFSVTGGGGYCAGGTGVHVGLSGSELGITYQLYNGATLWDATVGTGSALDFGLEIAAGYYTIVATNPATGCVITMTGSATVTINPLPVIFSVTGGGSYCSGGTGMHVGLGGSTTGISYQLYNGATTSGLAIIGSGVGIDFGLQTIAGSYTVLATNTTTGCTSIMSGSASIVVNPLPLAFTVTGSGGYCAGSTGTHVGLSGSNTGFSYQLNVGGSMSGSPVAGTGFLIDFGLRTVPGVYTVIATNTATGCFSTMTGSLTVSVNPLPTAYIVTGGGGYCAGTTGAHIGLNTSALGVNYQLLNGITPMGSPVAGTGSTLDLGAQTVPGTYTVVATNTATGCTNNMSGSTTIFINALPAAFTVTGGGGYCTGGTGAHVGLSASTSGINYQLLNGVTPVGLPVAGTGAMLDFGLQTAPGTYTVVATNNLTSCTRAMTGSVIVSINPLPNAYLVTGGGNYCFGSTGTHIGMATTDAGINYQLMLGGSPVGAPMGGTGGAIDFGLQTAVGTYSVTATNITTGCSNIMAGTPVVNISPLPVLQTVTGGGNYCPGGAGVDVGLNSSEAGVNYQLYNGTSPVGSPVTGLGSLIDFGLQTAPGIYTVKAINPVTTCTDVMTGSATVVISSLPTAYNVTGTGNYCPSGPGVHVGISGSDIGVNYQLYNTFGTIGIPVAGTGIALDFGDQTAGTYTVVATSTITGCSNNMSGSAIINISALPNLYIVTGGGSYCAGTGGVHVGTSGSDTGIHYQLFLGALPVGTSQAGTGSTLDFGLQTTAGTYTVVALSSTTTCSSSMTGSAIVAIYPLPVAYTVTGGGGYCTGGTGVHVTLSGSTSGIHYQLFRGATPVGIALVGSGAALDFGLQTVAGTYTVVATNTASGCVNNMTGSVPVVINTLPIMYTVSGGGNYCIGGVGEHIMLSGSNTGVNYQLYVTGVPTGTPIAGTGFGLDFGLQTAAGIYQVKATNATTGCINMMTGTATIVVNPLPHVYPVSSTTSNYCIGGSGVDIYLNTSDTGVNYQLYIGTAPVGSLVAGTGGVVDFGYQLPAGMYTAVATNATTSCTDMMSSSVTVVIDALPISYTVTGGGGYCSGTSGTHVGLSGSNLGHTYQLYVDGIPTGAPVNGTGSAIDFGLQTTTGAYSVIATNTLTTCTNTMSNIVNVSINTLPAVYVVTGGGNYCAGGTGVSIGVGGSQTGLSYQLYNGSSPSGSPVIGGGSAVDFGLVTGPGTYTIQATNLATSCSSTMLGTAVVGISPLPTAYPVIGGGSYCFGGSGVHIGVSGSHAGVNYQLYNGLTPVGSPMTSSGPAIDFGLQTAAGTYTVVGTDMSTMCVGNMSGSATVAINPLPETFTITGGGNYCSGTGGVHIGMNGSQLGVSYQLMNGIVAVGGIVSGSGGTIDFGLQTAAGTYSVIATNTTTTCTSAMAGTATVTPIASVPPIVNIVTVSGDTLCSGNFTTFTAVPVNGGTTPVYQWTVNGVVAGLSSTYAYIPLNGDVLSVTMTSNAVCATPSTASKTITLDVEAVGTPTVFVAAYPGSEVCQGSTVHFGTSPAFGGSAPAYTWYVNGSNVSTAANYSYMPSNGDNIYAVMNSNYHCRLANMATSNHIVMTVDVSMTPTVTVTSLSGLNITAGEPATFTANVIGGGDAPTYQWSVNSSPIPGATDQNYTSSTLSDMDIVSCQVWSSGGCAGIAASSSVTVHVTNVGVQQVVVASGDIKLIPNPNKGIFTIKGTLGTNTDEEVSVEVTDMIGQVVYTGKIPAHNGEINDRMQLNSVANGMYILNLHSGAGNMIFHLVIEQ